MNSTLKEMVLEGINLGMLNNYKLDVDEISRKLTLDKNSLKLNMIKRVNVLPFKTGSIQADVKQIASVESAFFRSLLGIKNINVTDNDQLLEIEINKVETEKKQLLNHMIKTMYMKDGELKKFHPILYTYGGKDSKGINDLAYYLIDSLITSDLLNSIRYIMKSEPNSVVDELVLNAIPFKIDENISLQNRTLLPEIQVVFSKDFKFICSTEKLFVENIDKLLRYYIFFYASQIILMLRNGFSGTNKIEEVYYFLDWEKISSSRISYKRGWKMISKKSENIFAYVNLFQILNCTLDGTVIGTFYDIKKSLNQMTETELHDFEEDINVINGLIMKAIEIDEHKSIYQEIFKEYPVIDNLSRSLIDAKDKGKGNRKAAFDKYERNIKELADLGFLKPRGQLGSALNLKHDWIIFFTRLCIGRSEKIRLNELWEEFELRGVYFDKFSKEKIIEYFEKINILEKKSDSGDAQYVRVL